MYQYDKEMYLLQANMKSFKKKVEIAIGYIKDALQKSVNPSLSFSGGKDSIVLLDLAIKAGFRGELLFFKYGKTTEVETPKENIELLKYYAEKYNLKYTIAECLGETDCWEMCGKFILIPESEAEKKIFRMTNYDFVKVSLNHEKECGIDLQIIGMRKDESKRRKAVLNKRGAIYQTKSRNSLTCCPILNFSDNDIWAYIFSRDLKYLSIYDYPFIDRRKNRNELTMLYNDAIMENGMLIHYKQMYPEFFVYLKEKYGEIT